MYVYIDESGDTGYTKKSTRYFILTAVVVEDSFVLERIIRKIYTSKKDKNKSNIFHAYRETDLVKSNLINYIKDVNIKTIVFVIDKRKVNEKDPYMYLLRKVALYFCKLFIYEIVLARRETRNNYNQKIIELFKFYNINFLMSNPKNKKSLQVADFYSWVIFVYMEYGQQHYFEKLKNHIVFI